MKDTQMTVILMAVVLTVMNWIWCVSILYKPSIWIRLGFIIIASCLSIIIFIIAKSVYKDCEV